MELVPSVKVRCGVISQPTVKLELLNSPMVEHIGQNSERLSLVKELLEQYMKQTTSQPMPLWFGSIL
ncbi:hypothetical protein B5V88_04480 [Heyndrickxia sporothermodurans]|nr:hypothetical protein B5V88_04480 [Heyndrickxia sporothermodurans]PTY82551.1 hypothetical protein B5V91_19345 [Heyndrickxia sporothermodurans]PTY83536.1 hypothetical protein B5V90_17330 [Heyndrickxia sporothermodurans]